MQVRNQRTLDTVFCNLYADELYHHGVEGMSWGDRNGPPYPLGGVDKKVARAEYKAKKEKERKLKKMQRAAKKARKIKAKNAKQEAEILKKKQKLVKEGDLDKIRKNANLFTNEELQYVIERDAQKRALGSKQERTADEKFELAMKRMAQIGSIAADAGKVLAAAKTGSEIITNFKAAKVKDAELEDKRLSAIKTEFEMRFKGREDSAEAQRFVNAAVRNEQYKPSKTDKKVAKEQDKIREQAVKESKRERKEANAAYKESKEQEKKDRKEEKRLEKQEKKFQKAQDKRINDLQKNFGKDQQQFGAEQQRQGAQNATTNAGPSNSLSRVETMRNAGFLANRTKYSSGVKFVQTSPAAKVTLSELGSGSSMRSMSSGRAYMDSISTNVMSTKLSELTPRASFSAGMPSISSPLKGSVYATTRSIGQDMPYTPPLTSNNRVIGMQNIHGSSTGSMGSISAKDARRLKKQERKRSTFW